MWRCPQTLYCRPYTVIQSDCIDLNVFLFLTVLYWEKIKRVSFKWDVELWKHSEEPTLTGSRASCRSTAARLPTWSCWLPVNSARHSSPHLVKLKKKNLLNATYVLILYFLYCMSQRVDIYILKCFKRNTTDKQKKKCTPVLCIYPSASISCFFSDCLGVCLSQADISGELIILLKLF